MIERHKINKLQFIVPNGDLQTFKDDLKATFNKTIKDNQMIKVTNGRCQSNELDNR